MKKILMLILSTSALLFSQNFNYINGIKTEYDKCGFNHQENVLIESTNSWGYSYDSLLADLNRWRMNPFIKVDSIGLSVQGRPLWQLTITDNPHSFQNKRTVFIHARTHPQETESFWVTREIIKIITSETNLGRTVRNRCVFYIIPMFNPDGVVLNRPRNNANNVDLESNWFTFPHQPEVAALKARFLQLMNSQNPIEVELNMHSSSLCKRYFVYHDAAGTSPQFAIMQQNYINGIRSYFPNGIEPWNYYVSWTNGTPMRYPECWFWINYGHNVMALTYEDMYQCSGTGKFDSTANALVRGVLDYMNIPLDYEEVELADMDFKLFQNYPNPFGFATQSGNSTTIKFSISPNSLNNNIYTSQKVSLKVFDILGREVATLFDDEVYPGIYEVKFSTSEIENKSLASNYILTSGIYFYQLQIDNRIETKKMILLK
ncbi:MAG: M14 family zinc carboxypeptidase [Ignavibacterium sp.]|nr:M14 family zinc carboxypeptidase [Ignavibacterium sp.]MDW8374612.1 M14 family zinc carboxypeptidase [Ignavibacteriales bacterium]